MKYTNPRFLWKLCALLGLATAVCGLLLMPVFPATGAGYLAGYGEPVFAFEFARSVPDLLLVFGAPDDPARAGRILDMVHGTYWDFGFLLIYSGFIYTFFLAAFNSTGTQVWRVFAVLGIVAGLADIVENIVLLGLMADIETARYLPVLPFPVYAKFIAITLCGLGVGAYLLGTRKPVWMVLGGLAIIGALAGVPGLVAPQDYGQYVGSAVTVFWVIQLAYAGRAGFRKSV